MTLPQNPDSRPDASCGGGLNRREFLGTLGEAALAGAALTAASVHAAENQPAAAGPPRGAPLRVKPVLTYGFQQRREFTSWRSYGGVCNQETLDKEVHHIEDELKALTTKADFGLEILPIALVNNDAHAATAAAADGDMLLVYAAGGGQRWLETLAASKKPNVMFLRHKSGPLYLWYEIAHFRFLRKSEDTFKEPNMDIDDIVVDDYDDVLWRLRALYGLKNTRGTKVIALGGPQAYSKPGQERGPTCAKEVWKLDVLTVPYSDVTDRVAKYRADAAVMKETEHQTADLLAQPNVTLTVDRRFVVNTFLAARAFKEVMAAAGATSIGPGDCMGGLIRRLDTPPCLVLSLLNDEGYTAYCHCDYTHTPAGILLHHISGKPTFLSNSHYPHHGMITLAHCSAPRKMNGKDDEPVKILTHFESDYGAATKVEYTKGQVTTHIVSNLVCTKWFGFRGRILDSPSYDACRSQMDVAIDGDWRRLLRDLQGFHTQSVYGDYLREIGYALKKVGMGWENVSET